MRGLKRFGGEGKPLARAARVDFSPSGRFCTALHVEKPPRRGVCRTDAIVSLDRAMFKRRQMIIACPACLTRYVVPDTAIGVEGRTVRCAKCRHSWFQQGPEIAVPEPAAATPEPDPAPVPADVAPAERTVVDAAPDPVPDPVAASPRPAPSPAPRASEPVQSPFAPEPPFRPRRNPLRLWTAAALVFALAVAAAIALVMRYGLPDWWPVARPTFAHGHADLELSWPAERQDRHTLPNGTEYFGVSGTVTNQGKDVREVPPILIVLRDANNRVVYTWTAIPPKDVLKPGESETINEALTDVPKNARVAEFGWKPE